MTRINKTSTINNRGIRFLFSDNTEKTIDFNPFIGEDKLSKPLSNTAYFKKVQLYDNGRGIYWPNGYDFCPDFLYQYRPDRKELVTDND